MEFFGSEIGVAIAWVCTVLAFVYAIFQKNECSKTKTLLKSSQDQIINLRAQLSIGDVKADGNGVAQKGEKNIYTKNNSGGMTIRM